MVYTSRIRGNADRRPRAFWGALIPAAINFVGGLITSSQQAKAQKRALEEQQRLAKQQLDISNQNQLAATLNNYASAQQSYDDKDYNLKYRIGGVKRLGSRNIMITDGGNAKRIGNNTYLLRGGSHEDINETGQTGIGINVGGNEIEAEGGEVAQRKGNSLRIYSAQPILGGISPAEAIMRGYNKDRVFNAQQRFKKNNGIKDDGSKAAFGNLITMPFAGIVKDIVDYFSNSGKYAPKRVKVSNKTVNRKPIRNGQVGNFRVINGKYFPNEKPLRQVYPEFDIISMGRGLPIKRSLKNTVGFVQKPNTFTRGIGNREGIKDLVESKVVRGNPVGTEMTAKAYTKATKSNRNSFNDIMNGTGREGISHRYYNRSLSKEDFDAIRESYNKINASFKTRHPKASGKIRFAIGDDVYDPLGNYKNYDDYLAQIASDRKTLRNATTINPDNGEPIAYFYDDGRNPLTQGHGYASSKWGVRISNPQDYNMKIFDGHLHYSNSKTIPFDSPNVEVFRSTPFGTIRYPKWMLRRGWYRNGGLTSKDKGSSKHPYPSVASKDFAGGNRSYPIPTKDDAIDALRLAGLHGRNDVRSKVYSKYPELRKKARGGTKVDPYYDWARNTSSNLRISFIDPTYDYRTYYNSVTPYERNLIRFAPQGTHFTDIGKTPKHPTFSNESIYSNKKHTGGTWNGNVFVPNIWQFGNNGNKARNKYMNNSGEGYFNGRVNVFPTSRKRHSLGCRTKLRNGGRPKAAFGDWVRTNRNNNVLANLLYESGIIDKNAWRNMLRDIHTFTGIGSDPYNDNQDEAVVTPGFGIVNKAQILRNVQQANRVAQASRASQAAQRTSYAVKQAKDFYRDLGINIPIGRSQIYNPTFRSSALARNIEDSNKALQISLNNTHLPKGIKLTPTDQSIIDRTAARIINPREAEIVRMGIPIGQSAKNMTSGVNPFLYVPRSSNETLKGLSRVISSAKQGAKSAGQKVGNKLTSSSTYRNPTFAERVRDANGKLIWKQNYKYKPWVKATAGAAGTTGVIGLGVGLSNTKSEDKNIKAQLDAKGKPISPYIARPQEPAKPQAKKSVPTRKDTTRTDTTRRDTTKQVNKVVKRQVRTTPQYKGNTTKGNYQLHDGETKVINGIKYTRRGNTIINHKTNVGYIYDKNGNYTGQADYSKVGNFNQAFDAARAAGRSQFIYRAGKYNNYSTVKETNAKKEALNRRIGAKRIAKRMGCLTNPPVGSRKKYLPGGTANPWDEYKVPDYGGTAPWQVSNKYDVNVPYPIGKYDLPITTITAKKDTFNDEMSKRMRAGTKNLSNNIDTNIEVPYLGRQNTFKPATQDYIGLGIDTLAALGSGLFTRSAYNKLNFDYALPNYVDESPVAFDTTYHNEAQRANVERNRLNSRNLIRGNTSSAQTALGRMQQTDTDAMMELNKLADEKANKEVELRNQNAANEQQVRARNAAARNQYYQNVAQIKNAALEAKNNAALAKAQSIGADLSGLSQAWTNFAGSVEQRYNTRQNEAIIAATSKEPAVLSNALQFGYNFSPEVLASIYRSTNDDKLKQLALSRLSPSDRRRYSLFQ